MSTKGGVRRRPTLRKALAKRCPVCGKVVAHSQRQAQELADAQYRARGGEEPARVYECTRRGYWHWTRSEDWFEPEPEPAE